MSKTSRPLLQVDNVSKKFPGVQALDQVDLNLSQGEVLAVIGENGAGKSTLMKILAGVLKPDSGTIKIGNQVAVMRSPREAQDLGVALIHQELNLCDNLDVAGNIFLGREPAQLGMLRRREANQLSADLLARVGLDIAPTTVVGNLSIGHQQLVEIAKALSINARILIMDEPTSSLTVSETDDLFAVIRDLKSRDVSVIYISHRLREVETIADRVSVLRDGKNAGVLLQDEIEHDRMVQLMVGRDVSKFYSRTEHEIGDPVLEVRDLVTRSWPAESNSFVIRAGEIVGISGLVGAGRTELFDCLFGIDPPASGQICIAGNSAKISSPANAIACGMALVPEDRKSQGLILPWTVRRNISLPLIGSRFSKWGMIRFGPEQLQGLEEIDRLGIRTTGIDQIAGLLSGGNQQKVVIGKWLATAPTVLLLDEPTRGIDVGAKQEIYTLMEKLAADGMAVLFVSSEMEEIIGMSDRVLVMHEGRITGDLDRKQLAEEKIMHLATTH